MPKARCPYCAEEFAYVPRRKGQEYWYHCAPWQQEVAPFATVYAHPRVDPVPEDYPDGRLLDQVQQIPWEYLDALAEGRVIEVALAGSPTAGKSVWFLGVGGHSEAAPAPRLTPEFRASHLSLAPLARDKLLGRIARLSLGELPDQSQVGERPDLLSLLLSLTCDQWPSARGPWWWPVPRRQSHVVVVKDVAGEYMPQFNFSQAVKEPQTRYLACARWHLLVLRANALEADVLNLRSLLRPFGDLAGKQRRKAVVAVSKVDEWLRVEGDDVFARAPCLFAPDRQQSVDASAYFAGMQQVQEEVRTRLQKRCGTWLKRLDDLYDQVYFSAFSTLGLPPAANISSGPAPGNPREISHCLTSPAMLRVVDPLLWILHDEGRIGPG